MYNSFDRNIYRQLAGSCKFVNPSIPIPQSSRCVLIGFIAHDNYVNLYIQLGLSGSDSLGVLLKNVRAEVRAALEELTIITTHDDNLEKQYKESE